MRISGELIERIFHKGDQQMLDNFKEMSLDDIIVDEVAVVSDLKASIHPVSGDEESYDFVTSLNDPDLGFMGLQGDHLKVVGEGFANGNAFTFESGVNMLRMEMEKTAETS